MNSPLRCRLLAGLPILAVVNIVLAAGCSGHKHAEVPAPDSNVVEIVDAGFEWRFDPFVDFNESGNSVTIGYMDTISCGNQAMYDYLDATRDRREALKDSINAWFKPIDLSVLTLLVNGVDPRNVITNLPDHVGKPFTPFLSPETLATENREDFLERVADDLAFAEGALHTSLSKFRDHVSYYLKEKINNALDEKFKHHLEPPKSKKRDHPSYIYDQTAEKLRRLSLAERREYLEALRVSLIEEYKDSRDPEYHEFLIRRFLRTMEDRDIIFDEERY